MGKKGSWFTALKKAFTSSSKDKPTTNVQLLTQVPNHKNTKEKKKWGFGRSKHSESASNSFIPLYREPSSIEKILRDAEIEQHHYNKTHQFTHKTPDATVPDKPLQLLLPPPPIRRFDHGREQQQQQLQNRVYVQQVLSDRTEAGQRRQQPRTQPVHAKKAQALITRPHAPRPRITPNHAHTSAVRIQSAFRGYMARRNYRALKGLMRLQGVMRGHSVKRQTAHAMKCMQVLVRVQSQVRARRVEAMERRSSQQHQAMLRGDREAGGGGRFGSPWSVGHQDDIWNDSVLIREEVDARVKRKVEAVIKRERALAYAYSHQLLKATPMAAHAILANLRSGQSPWWWSPVERPPEETRHFQPNNWKPAPAATNLGTATPRSVVSYSAKPRLTRPIKSPAPSKHAGIRDDESLTSCPPFAVPNYMVPTASAAAKAKARARAHVHQPEEKPRFSFGLGQSIGSWAKSPFWKDSGRSSRVGTPTTVIGRHRSTQSISGLSVDSTVSLPVGLGRRTFK